jgi:hypothetical protein
MAPHQPLVPDGAAFHPCKAFRDGNQTQYELCVSLGYLCDQCDRVNRARLDRLAEARAVEQLARSNVRRLARTNVHRRAT